MKKSDTPDPLHFGELSYSGFPTQGSVIVYASDQQSWVRVPVPEIVPVTYVQEWLHLWRHFPSLRWMTLVFIIAVLCAGVGVFGLL